jgi:uncharacterized protein with von Willebrand factor type A (vWA) domain
MTNPTRRAITETHRKLNFDTSRWERLLFEARAGAGVVADSLRAVATGERSAAPETTVRSSEADARDLGTEIFARLYADPAALPEPAGPAWTKQAHEIVEALPEFGALREAVSNDPDMAAIASAECLRAIAEKLPEILRESERDENEGDGNGTGGAGRGSADAAAVRAALRKAIGRATQRVGDAREALAGLAPGLEAAPPQHEQADAGRLTLAERLLRDPRLRDVLRKAGRISRLARDRRTTRDLRAREEVVDIERGADLARILPAGLARLRHPLLRKLALREIVERQAIQYRLEGQETLGRGPIVVLLDRSGSMTGEPEAWASAAAIALAGAGVRENRAVTIAEFTTTVDDVTRIRAKVGAVLSPRDPGVVVRDGLSIAEATIAFATRRSMGGTEFGPVLRYGMAAGALDDRADLVFVTDGLAEADADTLAQLTEAKRRGLRIWALTVNGGSLSPSIEAIADAAVDLDGADDVGAAIASAMPA